MGKNPYNTEHADLRARERKIKLAHQKACLSKPTSIADGRDGTKVYSHDGLYNNLKLVAIIAIGGGVAITTGFPVLGLGVSATIKVVTWYLKRK